MALYKDLQTVRADAEFIRRVQEAMLITARNILMAGGDDFESPLRRFARTVIQNKQAQADYMVDVLIAEFNTLTTTQMLAATDAAIQTAVTAAFPKLATA